LIPVEIHLLAQRSSSAKLSANAFAVGYAGVDMTFVDPDLEQVLHISIASVLSSSV
jgi:hypothetical protein